MIEAEVRDTIFHRSVCVSDPILPKKLVLSKSYGIEGRLVELYDFLQLSFGKRTGNKEVKQQLALNTSSMLLSDFMSASLKLESQSSKRQSGFLCLMLFRILLSERKNV